jgi:phosphoglycerate dehydrogenase-like enzyme
LKAFPVLREELGFKDEELAACMKLRLGEIEKIVAKRAGRGKGAAAKRDLQARLEEADAIVLHTTEELTTRRL